MGLCFKCGEKYFLGHNCKRQLLQLEGKEEEKEFTEEIAASDEIEEGGISLHALEGCPSNKIIKMESQTKGRKLMILIDSGSA